MSKNQFFFMYFSKQYKKEEIIERKTKCCPQRMLRNEPFPGIRCKVPTLIVPTVIVPTLKVPMLEVPTVQSSYDSQFLLIQCSYSCKVPTVQSSYISKFLWVHSSYTCKVPTGSKFIQFQCFYWFRVPTFRSSYRCKVSTGKISWNKIFLRCKVLAVAKLLIVPSCLLCIILLFLG